MEESDQDSVSVNSTVDAPLLEQYDVEEILDEDVDTVDGLIKYLVKWQGYPMADCTWEPESSFLQDRSLLEWKAKKGRIDAGIANRFDRQAWNREVDRAAAEKEQRRQRRERKRERLGLYKSNRTGTWVTQHASSSDESATTSDGEIFKTKATNASNIIKLPSRKRTRSDAAKSEGELGKLRKRGMSDDAGMVKSKQIGLSSSNYKGTVAATTKKPATSQMPLLSRKPSVPTKSEALKPKAAVSKASRKIGHSKLTGPEIFGSQNGSKEPKPRRASSSLGDARYNDLQHLNRARKLYGREPEFKYGDLPPVSLKDGKIIPEQQKQKRSETSESSKTPYQVIQDQRRAEAPPPNPRITESSLFLAEPAELEQDRASLVEDHQRARYNSSPITEAVTDPQLFSDSPGSPPIQHNATTTTASRRLTNDFASDASVQTSNPVPPELDYRAQGSWDSFGPIPWFHFSRLNGNAGSKKSDPSMVTNRRHKEDQSDIYCELMHDKVPDWAGWDHQKAVIRGLFARVNKLILKIKRTKAELPIRVDEFCSFKDYMHESQSAMVRYFGAGHMLENTRWRSPNSSVSTLCSELKEMDKGGLFFTEYFTMIIYPTGLKSWSQADSIYSGYDGPLRVIVAQSLLEWRSRIQTRRALDVERQMHEQTAQASLNDTDMAQQTTFNSVQEPEYYSRPQRADHPAVESQIHEQPAQRPFGSEDMVANSSSSRPLPVVEPTRDPRLRPWSPPCAKPHLTEAGDHETDQRSKIDQPPPAKSIENAQTPAKSETASIEARKNDIRAMSIEDNLKLFKERYGFDWNEMVPRKSNDQNTEMQIGVFVQYPKEVNGEREILIAFLQRVGAKSYDSDWKGDWRSFRDNMTAGVILIHESEQNFSKMPGLGFGPLTRPDINVYRVNLGTPYSPRAGQALITPNPGYVKLFPSGSMILLTDSVVLGRPKHVVRFLHWFRKSIIDMKLPFTWQFFTRPKFPSFIAQLLQEKAAVSVKDGAPYMDLWKEFHALVKEGDLEIDGDTPKPMAPFHSAPTIVGYELNSRPSTDDSKQDVLASNDDKLIRWFAELSLGQIEKRRKMSVIYDGPEKQPHRKWQELAHLRITTVDDFARGSEMGKWESDQAKRNNK